MNQKVRGLIAFCLLVIACGCNIIINDNNQNTDYRKPFIGKWFTAYSGFVNTTPKKYNRTFSFVSDSTYTFVQIQKNIVNSIETVENTKNQLGTWKVTKDSAYITITLAHITYPGGSEQPDTLKVPVTLNYGYIFKSSLSTNNQDTLVFSKRQVLVDDIGNVIQDTTFTYRYGKIY